MLSIDASLAESTIVAQVAALVAQNTILRERIAVLESSSPGVARAITINDAYELGTKGAPHSETERLLFEAYLLGHNWRVGIWDAQKRGYTDMDTRRLFAMWRDRASLSTLTA